MYFHKCSAKQHAQHLNTDIAVSSINLGMRLFQKLAWRTLQKQYEFVKRLFILAGLREPYSRRRECYSFVAFVKQCKPHGARAQSRSKAWPSQRPTGRSQPNLTENQPTADLKPIEQRPKLYHSHRPQLPRVCISRFSVVASLAQTCVDLPIPDVGPHT